MRKYFSSSFHRIFFKKSIAKNNPHKQPMTKLLYSEIVDNFDIMQTKYEVTEHGVYALY